MKNEELIIGGVILFLLLRNKKKEKTIVLNNNAVLSIDKGKDYKATIYSSKPIEVVYMSANNAHDYKVKAVANVADDFLNVESRNELKNIGSISNKPLPFIF
jgi:hypothetical protein